MVAVLEARERHVSRGIEVGSQGCGCEGNGHLWSVDDALAALLACARPLSRKVRIPIAAALGRVLAEAIIAQKPVPPFANSAMDGYAVCVSDFTGSGPFSLSLHDRIAAGSGQPHTLPEGCASAIFTGAPIPQRADAVVPVEQAYRDGGRIIIQSTPKPQQHIRSAGEDIEAGEGTLVAGRMLDPRAIGLLAASGYGQITVHDRPRVALVLTGDELVPSGERLAAGMIWDVNGPMLEAALQEAGAALVFSGPCKDDAASMTRLLRKLSTQCDLIITCGGVSVGEEDHAVSCFQQAGGALAFHGVAMKPGKPVAGGSLGSAVWLGLPGNPMSAFVGWTLFGWPLLSQMAGHAPGLLRRGLGVAANTTGHKPGRCEFRPAWLDGYDGAGRQMIHLHEATRSARMRDLADADALVQIPSEMDGVRAGDLVEYIPLSKFTGA